MFSPLTMSFPLLKGKVKCLFQIFSMKHIISDIILPIILFSDIQNMIVTKLLYNFFTSFCLYFHQFNQF